MARFVDVEAEGSSWTDLSDLPEHVQRAHLLRIEGDKNTAARWRAAEEKKAAAAAAVKTDEELYASGAAEAQRFLAKRRTSYFPEQEAPPIDYAGSRTGGGLVSVNEDALRRAGYL